MDRDDSTATGCELVETSDTKRKRESGGEVTEITRPATALLGESRSTESSLPHLSTALDESLPKRVKLNASSQHSSEDVDQTFKRIHGLTPMLWQKIFSLLPPVFLGRLLRVSRKFNSLLSTSQSNKGVDVSEKSDPDAESVWLASRQRYAPGLPKRLPNQTELDMWRLIRGSFCQICQIRKPLLTTHNLADQYQNFPEDGLRVIWPFGIRCCTQCLQDGIEQESSLMFSSSIPSFILPTLPCVFLTAGTHYVHSFTIKNSPRPPGAELSKVYYKPHIQNAQDEFQRMKPQGLDAAAPWIEELQRENKERTEIVLKWEQWETKGGLKKVNIRPGIRQSFGRPGGISANASQSSMQKSPLQNHESGEVIENVPQLSAPSTLNDMPASSSGIETINEGVGSNQFAGPIIHGPLPPRPNLQGTGIRPERNLQDVTEAKAERRYEIERRCLELDPPILANILCHMDSFQAALQIPQRLTEQAWELLKPRLLDQRQSAEEEEQRRIERDTSSREVTRERMHSEFRAKEDPETKDHAWDASQAPIRDRLSLYADERIRDRWSNGAAVNKESCATFAADVLLNVKSRFDDDHHKAQKPAVAANQDQISNASPDDNVLILENMKWVYDNKIRPLTESHHREIFLCSICEGASKYYGFEAVIQHYAAKHTNVLSQGNIVVHWRAKWPDQPPFHPSPGLVKSQQISTGPIIFPASDNNATPSSYPTSEQSKPWMQMPMAPYPYPRAGVAFPPTLYQPYQGHGSQPIVGQYPGIQPAPLSVNPTYPQAHADPRYPPNAPQYATHWPPQVPPVNQNSQVPITNVQVYQAQLNDMAKHARELWYSTGGVKDMPASLRIFVVIQHVATRLLNQHKLEPSLHMFLEGLNQNSLMRPVRSVNGLTCKTCAVRGQMNTPDNILTAERKAYTLPLLLNHFKSSHLENMPSNYGTTSTIDPSLNWKTDMIELPDPEELPILINANGMDNGKLALIAEALPGYFPHPLPKAGSYRAAGTTSRHSPKPHPHGLMLSLSSEDVHKQHRRRSNSRERDSTRSNGSRNDRRSRSCTREWEPAGEDEYDPHRPAYLGQMVGARKQSYPDRVDAPKETFLRAGNNDYDPEQPMLNRDAAYQSDRPHHRPPKIEVVEADLFLSNLQPHLEPVHGNHAVHDERVSGLDEAFPPPIAASRRTADNRVPNSRESASESAPQSGFEGRDAHAGHQKVQYLNELSRTQISRRSPRNHRQEASQYEEQTIYVSPSGRGLNLSSSEWAEITHTPREPAPLPTARYLPADSRSPAPRSSQEAPVQYFYTHNVSYEAEPDDRNRKISRQVQYIPVEDYRSDPRYTQLSLTRSPGPFPVARESDAHRRLEGRPLVEESYYVAREKRSESEEGALYREYR